MFRTRVREALEDGIVLGVKIAVASTLGLFALGYALGDYQTVRSQAANGQQAYMYLVQQQEAARASTQEEANGSDTREAPGQPVP